VAVQAAVELLPQLLQSLAVQAAAQELLLHLQAQLVIQVRLLLQLVIQVYLVMRVAEVPLLQQLVALVE
jgi:hypothetical protein